MGVIRRNPHPPTELRPQSEATYKMRELRPLRDMRPLVPQSKIQNRKSKIPSKHRPLPAAQFPHFGTPFEAIP